jgi:Tol biopolymer transport system component
VSRWITIGGRASGFAVHPSRTSVALVRTTPQGDRVVVFDTATGNERIVASGGKYEGPRWSPSGGLLAWSGPAVGGDESSNGIWVAAPDAHAPRRVVKDGYAPAWGAEGRALFYARVRVGAADSGLWRVDIQSAEVTKVRNWDRTRSYDVWGSLVLYAGHRASAQVFDMKLDLEEPPAR